MRGIQVILIIVIVPLLLAPALLLILAAAAIATGVDGIRAVSKRRFRLVTRNPGDPEQS